MAKFTLDISKWAEATTGKLDLAIRKISLEMFFRVIFRTPVDTGRARANWQVAINEMATDVLELNDKEGTATISAAAAQLAGVKAGDVIYLVNNLKYISFLETGSSQQAPAGMVGITVAEFQQIVDGTKA